MILKRRKNFASYSAVKTKKIWMLGAPLDSIYGYHHSAQRGGGGKANFWILEKSSGLEQNLGFGPNLWDLGHVFLVFVLTFH